jgi:hypothetical protein
MRSNCSYILSKKATSVENDLTGSQVVIAAAEAIFKTLGGTSVGVGGTCVGVGGRDVDVGAGGGFVVTGCSVTEGAVVAVGPHALRISATSMKRLNTLNFLFIFSPHKLKRI